jgi:hypothetical protein
MKQVQHKKIVGTAIAFECFCICVAIVFICLILNKVKIDAISTSVLITLCLAACTCSLVRFCMPSQKALVRSVTFLFFFYLLILLSKLQLSRIFLLCVSAFYVGITLLENLIGNILTKEQTVGRINVNRIVMTCARKSFFRPVFLRMVDILLSSLLIFFLLPTLYIIMGIAVKLAQQGETLVRRRGKYVFNTYRALFTENQGIVMRTGVTLCQLFTQFHIHKAPLFINIWRGQLSFFHKNS